MSAGGPVTSSDKITAAPTATSGESKRTPPMAPTAEYSAAQISAAAGLGIRDIPDPCPEPDRGTGMARELLPANTGR